MGFILFLVAFILSVFLYPLSFLTSVVINLLKPKEALRKLNRQCLDIAVSIDANGNVVADDLFNQILIKKRGYKFGKRKETISSVLGKNQLTHTLTWVGWLIASTLDLIQSGHCLKSIDNAVD